MEKYLLVIVAGIVGGLLAQCCNVSGGAVGGAMLFSGVMALLLPKGISMSANVATEVQILLGIFFEMTFDRSFLSLGIKVLPLAIFCTIAGCFYIYRRKVNFFNQEKICVCYNSNVIGTFSGSIKPVLLDKYLK